MITHRFTKTFKMMTTCDYCDKQMFMGLKCKECKYKCHRDCASKVPPSCGLPQELIDEFKKTLQADSEYLIQIIFLIFVFLKLEFLTNLWKMKYWGFFILGMVNVSPILNKSGITSPNHHNSNQISLNPRDHKRPHPHSSMNMPFQVFHLMKQY